MEEKSLLEFIKALDQLNGANLHYLTGQDPNWYKVHEKYRKELTQVMDLINGFDFINDRPAFSRLLLSSPMPELIRRMFVDEK